MPIPVHSDTETYQKNPSPVRRMKVTQKDIAQELGLSQSAVSAVINDPETSRVSDENRKRILSFIDSVGYSGPAASKKTAGSTYCLIWSGVERNPITTFLPNLHEAITDRDSVLVEVYRHGQPTFDPPENVAGFLVCCRMPETITAKLAKLAPTVVINQHRELHACDMIHTDEIEGLRLTVQHLVDKGHRRMAFLGDVSSTQPTEFHEHYQKRYLAFRQAQWLHQLPYSDDYERIMLTAYPKESVFRDRLAAMLALPEPPTAIVCYNDVIAHCLCKDAEILGLRVPDDISIVGFENYFIESFYSGHRISTVDGNRKEMINVALRILKGGLENQGSASNHILVRPFLIEGNTVKDLT